MNLSTPQIHPVRVVAFTLIEVLLAIGIFAVVLAAINTVFFAGMRLRAKTTEVLEDALPTDRAVSILKRDLAGIVNPGVLAGVMSSDTTVPGISQQVALEIYTTTGVIDDDVPWGDVQKVDYSLQFPSNNTGLPGKDLVRSVTRNLLATDTETPVSESLLSGVQSLTFNYFDGTNWNDTWSSTLSNIPAAIRVSIDFAIAKNDSQMKIPIKLLVPVVMNTNILMTNSTSTN
jgi:type II secretion system protein J